MIITINTPVKTRLIAGKLLVSWLKRHLFSLVVENIAKIK
ncbi:ubiquinol oxidase subunit II [Enterobacter sp. 10-1]|nr:ubiquinol oxidase subunit II [Raoultella terrigena]PAC08102.1 ubiquinol oxidase subunit II [Enterobacter sp. 10-1]